MGNLAADPRITKAANGKKLAFISIAIPRPRRPGDQKENVDFVQMVAWERMADMFEARLVKGDMILVRGQVRVWPEQKYLRRPERQFIEVEAVRCIKIKGAEYGDEVMDVAMPEDEYKQAHESAGLDINQPEIGDDDMPF